MRRAITPGGLGAALVALVAAAALMLSVVLAPGSARAQSLGDEVPTTSYINPFPDNDLYRLQLVGDSFAEGLLDGIKEAFDGDARLRVERQHLAVPGLVFSSWDKSIADIESQSGPTTIHIAVVMLGSEDRQQIRLPGGKRIRMDRDEWRTEYAARVDRMMKALKARGSAVYWLGQPILRRESWNEDVRVINEIIRERALLNGVKFIDTYQSFADENGEYSDYGPDLTGKVRELRWQDGVHFTATGYRKLAHFAETEIRRDLKQAQSERMVPLLGSEAQQKRIRPAATASSETQRSGWTSLIAPFRSLPRRASEGAEPAPAGGQGGDQKEETVTVKLPPDPAAREAAKALEIEILRPAIPAAIVALVTRRASADRAAQFGRTMVSKTRGGFAVLTSITPSAADGEAGRRKLAPTQMPFFKVWAKGERLIPRQDRADDFAWPRPEPEVLVTKVAVPARELARELSPPAPPPPAWTGPPLPARSPFR